MPDEAMTTPRPEAEAAPEAAAGLELDLLDIGQLVTVDAAWPLHPGCLRPAAEAAIIDWARRQPKDVPLVIVARLPASTMPAAERIRLAEALSAHFRRLANEQDYNVREFLTDARRSAAVGFAVFAACILAIWTLYSGYQGSTTARAIRETLSILGWIAAWKPLEMLVHERRPLLRRLRLLRRLAQARVIVMAADRS